MKTHSSKTDQCKKCKHNILRFAKWRLCKIKGIQPIKELKNVPCSFCTVNTKFAVDYLKNAINTDKPVNILRPIICEGCGAKHTAYLCPYCNRAHIDGNQLAVQISRVMDQIVAEKCLGIGPIKPPLPPPLPHEFAERSRREQPLNFIKLPHSFPLSRSSPSG